MPRVVKQQCPRRRESPAPDAYGDGTDTPDRWTTGHGLVGVQGDSPSCSYCGSLNPDEFIKWVRDGGKLGVTSKRYKIYIDCPYPNPRYGETKTEQRENGSTTTVYGRTAKFYFQHLDEAQKREFVDLYNDKELDFGGIDRGDGTIITFEFGNGGPFPFFMERAAP